MVIWNGNCKAIQSGSERADSDSKNSERVLDLRRDLIIKVVDEEIHTRSAKKDIISKWSKIAKSEGGNVRRDIIYGDKII